MSTSHTERVENLYLAKGWRPVSLEQRGPDGTEVIGMLLFYVCPVCAVVVAEGNEDNDFLVEHRAEHERLAKWQDEVDRRLRVMES